jgi:hypothetical protein
MVVEDWCMSQSSFGATGVPGGMSRPWIVVRQAPLRQAIPKPDGVRQGLGLAQFAFVVVAVAFVGPARGLYLTLGPMAAAGFVIVVAGLVAVIARRARVGRVEWNGQEVVWYSGAGRKVVGAPGAGQVVRANIAGNVDLGAIQYWVDGSGEVAGRFAEMLWDHAELGRIAEQARIPVVDLGRLSAAELSERYPAIMPKFQASLITKVGPPDRAIFGIPPERLSLVLAVGIAVVLAISLALRAAV